MFSFHRTLIARLAVDGLRHEVGEKMPKRRFGYVRELPSGKFQASYAGPDGGRHIAPTTFTHRSLAEEYLKTQQALIQLGQWKQEPPRDGSRGTPTFGDYCEHHISLQTTSRGELLEASTQHLYRNLLRTHLSPFAALHLVPGIAGQISLSKCLNKLNLVSWKSG